MKEKLIAWKEQNEIVNIYIDQMDTGRFMAGFLYAVDDDYFVLKSISPEGLQDGFILGEWNTIFKIEIGDSYTKQLKFLSEYHHVCHENIVLQGNLKFALLQYAQVKHKVVTIEFLHGGKENAVGFIERIDGNNCYFHSITEHGEEADELVIHIESITLMTCDGVNERMIGEQGGCSKSEH